MALFCGTTFAQDAYKTLTFPDDNSANNKISAYNKEWTAMSGGDSWTINCFNNNKWDGWSYIRCGWRTDATVASIATDFAIDQPIENVVVTFDKLSSTDKINSIYLVVASDAGFNDVVETVQAPNMTAGDMTFAVTAPTANCYYKLVVDCQKMSSNGVVQISKLAYYKSGDEPVIVDISNTPETAYTVAKAHELIEAGEGLATSVYVKGVITEVGDYNSDYGQVNYYINDADGAGEDLYIYGGLYLKGEKFTSNEQIKVGDEVVVYGTLIEYNGTHEMNYGNYIYSLNGKTEPDAPSVDISNTPETAYPVAEANDLITAGEGLTTEVYVKGVITKIDEISTDYGNATYYINDTETEEGLLYIYRGYYLNGDKFTAEDQIKVGDNVIVFGQLVNFYGTYEMTTGSSIYSLNGETTGIDGVTVDNSEFDENAPVYNLAGQLVSKNAKGILIQNGKKFIRK